MKMQQRWFVYMLLVCPLFAESEYQRRVNIVSRMPGFVVLWDFVKRNDGRFAAHQPKGDTYDLRLDAVNYVRDYWSEGRAAIYVDFPLLGRGPFGQAVQFVAEQEPDFRPCLLVPRERLHDSGIDIKGPGRSASMVVWMIRSSGNHAIAGIWHEGTDLHLSNSPAVRVERGKRQYALFAGLAANNGASAVHVSENGAKSFGDRYARNLAVTPEVIPAVPDARDEAWTTVGFTFDNHRNTVTAYLDGKATDYWIDNPEKHPFFQWPANGWTQAQLHRMPGLQDGEDPAFPHDQFYTPPEDKPHRRSVVERREGELVELHEFAFTKVRVTLRGKQVLKRELIALKANPFWFEHDLYTPDTPQDGGPFTIGRVIHSSRSVGITGWIGGVAVFGRALAPSEMRRLASIGTMQLLQAP
jgi:hypothetical protein